MKIIRCNLMLLISVIWIFISIIYLILIKAFPLLSIISIVLCLFASYDSYSRYKCYIILSDYYISVNGGILNGFNTLELQSIEGIEINKNKVYIFENTHKKITIYLSLLDKNNRNNISNYLDSKKLLDINKE